MKVITYQLFIAVALFVGVAIGYLAGDRTPAPAEEKASEPTVRGVVADKGEEASVKALRHRIAELEKALAEKGGAEETAISNAVAEAVRNRPPEPPRGNWRERMEAMKKNEPERYTQMTNRFAQWRQSQAERARNKIDFLASIDTSHMSAAAKKTHAALQELIARREDVESRLQDPNLSDEERNTLMHELWSSHHELQRLNGEERRNLIDEAARSMGFEGEDAKEVSATIHEVIEATDSGWGGGPRHRGGPHGPRPGGPGGR